MWPLPAAVRVIRWGGGPRAGVGTWCPGSPMSSAPKVATAGGQAGEPVLQVAPGQPMSSAPSVAIAGGRAGEPVLQVAPGQPMSSAPSVAIAGGRAGDPVLQVPPGPPPGSGALGRRRARRPRWLLPAARRVNRFCRLSPGRRRDPVPKVASGGGWGVIWCAVGPGPPRARGPVWPLSAAVRVIRWGGGPRAGVGTWCPGSPMSSAPSVAIAGGRAGDPVGRWPSDRRRDPVPRAAAGSGPKVATAGGPAGEPVLQVANAGGRAGDPVLRVAPGPPPGSGALGRRRTRCPRWPPVGG